MTRVAVIDSGDGVMPSCPPREHGQFYSLGSRVTDGRNVVGIRTCDVLTAVNAAFGGFGFVSGADVFTLMETLEKRSLV